MADTKISDLTAASALTGTEEFPCSDGTATTKAATAAQIKTYFRSPLILPIHGDASANVTMTNQANSEQFLGNSNRNIFHIDLTGYTEARLCARVVTGSASANTPRIYAEYHTAYSTTAGDYSDIGTSAVSVSLTTAGYVSTSWVALASGAKADVYVTVFQNGGDGAADPAVGPVSLQFR